jgi:acyl-CoA synthetase (AMP-forming)/AMP-acid ligase II
MNATACSRSWSEDVAGRLIRIARQSPDRPAVTDAHGTTTFGDLYTAAVRHAHEVERQTAVVDGGVAALHAASNAAFVAQLCGELMAGRTPLVLPPRLAQETAEQALSDVRHARSAGCHAWKAVLAVLDGRQVPVVTHGESPGASRKALALGMMRGGRSLIAAPLHLNGPLEFALRQLLLGGSVTLLPRFTPDRWVKAVHDERPDWAFLVPTQLQHLWDSVGDRAAGAACAPLRRLVHSSAPCPEDQGERLAAGLGFRLWEYYGTTLYDGTLTRPGQLAGRPLPGAQLRIVDRHHRPVLAGTTGQVEGRSFSGLISHPANLACRGQPVWQGVGDIGRLLPGGRVQITEVDVAGRVIVAGVKVAPEDTRQILLTHPDVTACTVTAVSHPRFGSVLAATVQTHRCDLTRAELRSWCARWLTSPQRPHALEVHPCLP